MVPYRDKFWGRFGCCLVGIYGLEELQPLCDCEAKLILYVEDDRTGTRKELEGLVTLSVHEAPNSDTAPTELLFM